MTSPSRVYLPQGVSRPCYVPPLGFLNLSAVYSASRLCGLIPYRSHVQDFPVQGFLISRSRPNSSPSLCPLAVSRTSLIEQAQLPRRTFMTPRPCSTRSSVSNSLGLTAPLTAPLFRFAFPPGSSLSSPGLRFTRSHPLMTL
jgi:hypothetical protein